MRYASLSLILPTALFIISGDKFYEYTRFSGDDLYAIHTIFLSRGSYKI